MPPLYLPPPIPVEDGRWNGGGLTVPDPIIALPDDDRVVTIAECGATPDEPPILTGFGWIGWKRVFFRGLMTGVLVTAAVAGAVHWSYLDRDAKPTVEAREPAAPAPDPASVPAATPGAIAALLTDAYDANDANDDRPTGTSQTEQARTHLRSGVELYNERDLGGALVELKRAYDLAPRYQILYNLGQIAYQQQDYLNASRNLRRYLAEGGDAVPAGRRSEVEAESERLEQRIGRLLVQAPPRTRILIDGNAVGVTPLGSAIEANVGRRHLHAISPTGDRWSSAVDLTGGDAVTVMVGPPRPRRLAPRPGDGPIFSEDEPMPPGSAKVRD